MFAQIDELYHIVIDGCRVGSAIDHASFMVTGILSNSQAWAEFRSGISEKLSNLCLKMKKTDTEK